MLDAHSKLALKSLAPDIPHAKSLCPRLIRSQLLGSRPSEDTPASTTLTSCTNKASTECCYGCTEHKPNRPRVGRARHAQRLYWPGPTQDATPTRCRRLTAQKRSVGPHPPGGASRFRKINTGETRVPIIESKGCAYKWLFFQQHR